MLAFVLAFVPVVLIAFVIGLRFVLAFLPVSFYRVRDLARSSAFDVHFQFYSSGSDEMDGWMEGWRDGSQPDSGEKLSSEVLIESRKNRFQTGFEPILIPVSKIERETHKCTPLMQSF